MSSHQVGSLCEDCLSSGLQNYLKTFFINLEEQIVKCESSLCMFPYLRKPICASNLTEPKEAESFLSLDDFVNASAEKINIPPTEVKPVTTKEYKPVDGSILADFSYLFMDQSKKFDDKPASGSQPVINSENQSGAETPLSQMKCPPKARITRCLMNVRSSAKSASKKTKGKSPNPVLVVEPKSGKRMRPLDIISHYVKSTGPGVWSSRMSPRK